MNLVLDGHLHEVCPDKWENLAQLVAETEEWHKLGSETVVWSIEIDGRRLTHKQLLKLSAIHTGRINTISIDRKRASAVALGVLSEAANYAIEIALLMKSAISHSRSKDFQTGRLAVAEAACSLGTLLTIIDSVSDACPSEADLLSRLHAEIALWLDGIVEPLVDSDPTVCADTLANEVAPRVLMWAAAMRSICGNTGNSAGFHGTSADSKLPRPHGRSEA